MKIFLRESRPVGQVGGETEFQAVICMEVAEQNVKLGREPWRNGLWTDNYPVPLWTVVD